jgi:hypothetical protein
VQLLHGYPCGLALWLTQFIIFIPMQSYLDAGVAVLPDMEASAQSTASLTALNVGGLTMVALAAALVAAYYWAKLR